MELLKQRIKTLATTLNIEQLRAEAKRLKQQSEQPSFWRDQVQAATVSQRLAAIESTVQKFTTLEELLNTTDLNQSTAELEQLVKDDLTALERLTLLKGQYDDHAAILSVYAGAGGTDAQDWVAMLLRMYQRYVERGREQATADPDLLGEELTSRRNWSVELLDIKRGEEAGIKSVTLLIKGSYAYGLLKAEAGVHRLVRQSPFNAKALRQTSFALVDVIPQITASDKVELDEQDIRVDVFRSSGKGGQSVNTTDSAVRLTHLPTGIVVSIQNERSQLQNKTKALEILKSRLFARQEEQLRTETAKVRGQVAKNEWGSQIRSYILHPYKLVKDHRTEVKTKQVDEVLDGDLPKFINGYLSQISELK